jgi:hypothetical protein
MGSVTGSASSCPYSASDYPPPPVPTEPAIAPKKPSKANPVRKKQSRPMATKREISEGKKKVERIKHPVTRAYTSENPKYRVGKSLLSVPELRTAGQYCVDLHNYYMRNVNKAQEIMVSYESGTFCSLRAVETSLLLPSAICSTFSTSTLWIFLSFGALHCKSIKTCFHFNAFDIRSTI